MLEDATADGLTGTMLAFSIPEATAAPKKFHSTFDTSSKHVCWFDGRATLRLLGKRVGKSRPLTEEERKQSESILTVPSGSQAIAAPIPPLKPDSASGATTGN